MGKVTTGGIAVKVLTGRRAAPLQRYRDSVEKDVEPPLFMMTRHCSHDAEIQIVEWKATRELHGTQGARRKPRASFEEVDPSTGLHPSGRPGTHVEFHDGKRLRKRLVRENETPTHYRVPPQELMVVKESEAVHTIYAAGPDLIDPEDHEALERFFIAVCAERDERYPGLQESRWLERNGKSGLVHVHVASNATIYADFELDGKTYKAGLKMAGELTYKDSVRGRFEQYLDEHPEHGFKQGLARVGSPEYREAQVSSGQKDYWDGKHGQVSNHEKIRLATFEALQVDGVTERDSWQQAMTDRGIEVKEVGLRRGKPTKSHDYSYRVAGTTTWTRGRTLGPQYTHQGVEDQLDRRAAGQLIEPRRDKQQTGPRAYAPLTQHPLSVEDHLELVELRRQVEANGRGVREARAREAAMAAEAARLQALDTARRATADQAATEQQEREALQRQERIEEARQRQAQLAATAQTEHDEAMARITQLLDGNNVADPDIGVDELDGDTSDVRDPASTAALVLDETPADNLNRWSARPSALRRVTSTSPRMQERISALAELEEDYRGRAPDAEFESRIQGFGGVDAQFLQQYRRHLDPSTEGVLRQRVAQDADRASAVDERTVASETLDTLQARPKLFDSSHDERVHTAKRDLKFITGYVDRVDAARAAGDYRPRTHERDEHREREATIRENSRTQRLADMTGTEPEVRPVSPQHEKALAMQRRLRVGNQKRKEAGKEKEAGLSM